jgi:hypothetical protein
MSDQVKKAFENLAASSGYVPVVFNEKGEKIWEGEMIPFSIPDAYQKCQEITKQKIKELSAKRGEAIAETPDLTEKQFLNKVIASPPETWKIV